MADKTTKSEPVIAAATGSATAAPVVDAFTLRCERLAALWNCTVEEAKQRETERLAAKKQKAAQ